jgi:hypothetical protein
MELPLEFATARSLQPSPLKSPAAIAAGDPLITGLDEFVKPNPGVPTPNVAVVTVEFPVLVSRKEIVPVGDGDVVAPAPTTVAVRV